ncbi:MAG: TIGR04295 family B12-binding domain-containing radical SAM protein [Kastovskya adunca ATA6-11-RM4]|jgi:B12-binding domain/radical SAM domain protein of rhizo-twelve system|nr:TIGR04295 family B12-binding domain-containing radical SAM protein [Kastovskya adunca ATA6-11-RM4]
MKYALINPNWTFTGSIYFGCREPHLPLEYGYAKALLEQQGHEVLIVDGQLYNLSPEDIRNQVAAFKPDFTVVTTAPSYLFWRCAPPELRVPQETVLDLRNIGGTMVAVGPHGSTTPKATLKKLGVDVVVLGECEEFLPKLTENWENVSSICYWDGDKPRLQGSPHTSDMTALPALHWQAETIQRHHHHHHRFEAAPTGAGAEMETSRGCPYHCSFCAKDNFRNSYRKRPLAVILEELDGLIAQGVEYVYFIDEIFLPNRSLLEALVERPVKFGIQTRIDLWTRSLLELLGRAGCVSIEAGVESISEQGRQLLDKNCKLSTEALSELLIHAKKHVPFVQANLLEGKVDDPEAIAAWRQHLQQFGVWANKPVPLFPYPGSPDYTKKWGFPDEEAWERANAYYLDVYAEFSDIQDEQPLPLSQLELSAPTK